MNYSECQIFFLKVFINSVIILYCIDDEKILYYDFKSIKNKILYNKYFKVIIYDRKKNSFYKRRNRKNN